MFNSAKLWIKDLLGLGERTIHPEDFETFWREFRSEDSHLKPNVFYNDFLSKYQVSWWGNIS
jgi:hypothetical protein